MKVTLKRIMAIKSLNPLYLDRAINKLEEDGLEEVSTLFKMFRDDPA